MVSSHIFTCESVTRTSPLSVVACFINDSCPRPTSANGELQTGKDWRVEKTLVKRDVLIGFETTILSNVVIGGKATVGAGSVVTRNVPPTTVIVAGIPATKCAGSLPRHLQKLERINDAR
jgi:carbonic anhydrase/acetyltransferase-like protein (isoleucine patch superfamily)